MLWVRPGVLEANASRFCCVSVLMQVDLPALERPTNAISGCSCGGRNSSLGAVVRKRAVCSQASARSAAVEAGAPGPGVAVMGRFRRGVWMGAHCRIAGFCANESTTDAHEVARLP